MTNTDAATTRTLHQNLEIGMLALSAAFLTNGTAFGKEIDAMIQAAVKAAVTGRQTNKQIRETQQKARQAFARALSRKVARLG